MAWRLRDDLFRSLERARRRYPERLAGRGREANLPMNKDAINREADLLINKGVTHPIQLAAEVAGKLSAEALPDDHQTLIGLVNRRLQAHRNSQKKTA